MGFTKNLLEDIYQQRKNKNQFYSYRAYARDLGINRNSLSQALLENRCLSKKSIDKIVDALNLNSEVNEDLLKDNNLLTVKRGAMLISAEEFEKINHLDHFALLSMLKNKNYMWTEGFIAKKLNLSVDQVRILLADLKEIGFIEKNGDHFIRIVESFSIESEVPVRSIQKFHQENLERAHRSIDDIDVSLRDISSMTFNMKKDNIQKAKDEIKKFRRKLANLVEDEGGEDVYSLSISLHPITEV